MINASTIHLIGIGGTGLSAIARVLKESGYQVTGSDQQLSPLALSLQEEDIPVYIGHRRENIGQAEMVVISSAIPEENIEVQTARALGIPVVKRSDFLGELMTNKYVVAIAGSHGKTTTTAMVAWILTYLQQDPSYIIGGVSKNLGTNAHAGDGTQFVIEADEYDRMFLGLRPDIAVITNIEHDHPDCYPTFEEFFSAFSAFTTQLNAEGILIINADDPGANKLKAEINRKEIRVICFSLEDTSCEYKGENLFVNPVGGYSFDVHLRDIKEHNPLIHRIDLQIPGKHNVRNALAALAVTHQIGLSAENASNALGQFTGTGRRFDVIGEVSGITVINDYAHHPSEITAVLEAARAKYPERALWAVWQPHTYSRTRALAKDFAAAFSDANHVLVTEIYPSREPQPADGYSARQVVRMIDHEDVHFMPELNHATMYLLAQLREGDVLLVLSAGDADQISNYVLAALEEREHSHV